MKKILYPLALSLALAAPCALRARTGYTLFRMKDALLVKATAQGNVSLALTLLSLPGINPSAQDAIGRTPLHYAAEQGLLALTQALLVAGADHTIKDDAGETPRSLADKADQHEIELLLGA